MARDNKALLIAGYHGVGNIGDDLMLLAFIQIISNNTRHGTVSYFVYGRNDLISRSKHRIIQRQQPIRNVFRFLELLFLSDGVCWVGGTCFTEREGDGFYRYMRIAHAFGKRFGYVGVGVDPIRNHRRKRRLAWLVQHAAGVSVRDSGSRRIVETLRGNGLIRTHMDLGEWWAKLQIPKILEHNVRNYVLVAWRDLSRHTSEWQSDLQSLAERVVSHTMQHNWEVRLLVVDENRDREVTEQLRNLILQYRPAQTVDIASVGGKDNVEKRATAAIELIANSRMVWTARFHVGVVAKLTGTPFAGMEYSSKWDQITRNCDKLSGFSLPLKVVYPAGKPGIGRVQSEPANDPQEPVTEVVAKILG